VISNENGDVYLVNMEIDHWKNVACLHAGRNLTHAEWLQFFPNEKYRKTCEHWSLESEESATSTP
jgi:hypothetical protein